MTKAVVLSWSGGKDSSLALEALRADDRYEVVGLLTSITSSYDRVSIHGVRRALVEAQASEIGLPLYEVTLDPTSSNEAYEAAFLAALRRLREVAPDVEIIAFGDLHLEDVRAYRERLLRSTRYKPVFPLWGSDTALLAAEFIARGFRAVVVCVDTTQLAGSYAGHAFDIALLAELPPGVDPCGEGGEFHTFVHSGPVFGRPIPVQIGATMLRDDRFMFCELEFDGVVATNAGALSASTCP